MGNVLGAQLPQRWRCWMSLPDSPQRSVPAAQRAAVTLQKCAGDAWRDERPGQDPPAQRVQGSGTLQRTQPDFLLGLSWERRHQTLPET